MATLTQWELVAETKEWVGPISVSVNEAEVDTFTVCVAEGQSRPITFLDPDPDPDGGGGYGVLVGVGTPWPLTVGRTYTIFIKYADTPETPVERAGRIKVT
jgi:hypothetical protein